MTEDWPPFSLEEGTPQPPPPLAAPQSEPTQSTPET
jgi:hypothetical protein